jgi:hypothetical protein
MAENIELAKFNLNVSDIVKGATVLKKEIDAIKEEQKDLKKNGEESSTTFVENAGRLKALNSEYGKHIKALAETAKQATDTETREARLEVVLGAEVKTIKEARQQNKLLNDLRNTANLTTAEGQAEIEQLNDALDRNNAIIKENVDQYTQQKINIGNYTESINEALSGTDRLTGNIGGLSGGLSGAVSGMVSFTKASLAFLATPVGLVLGVIAGAFLLIKNALDRSEESTNKLKKAFAPFIGIIQKALSFLEPLGEFLIDGLVAGLEFVEEAIYTVTDAFAGILDFLGFDDLANSIKAVNKELREGAKGAQELADAEAELEKAQRKARLVQLEYLKEAEELRQVRDDESKSIQERIKANDELGAVLEQQLQEELAIANQALIVANLRIEQEGRTKEALDAQYEALTEIADVEERITGQRSEQIVNRVSLEKEAVEKAREANEARIAGLEEELALYESTNGFRATTLREELDFERELSRQKLAILKDELNSKLISQEAYQAEVNNLNTELARREAELLIDNAFKALEVQRELNTKKLEANAFLSDTEAERRKLVQQQIFEDELAFQQLQLEQGLINQDEFDKSIRELKEQNRIAFEAIDKEREAVKLEEEKELRALRFEEELQRKLDEGATALEIERAQAQEARALAQQQAQQDLENGLISQELYRARLAQIDSQYNQGEAERSAILRDQKIANVQGVLSAVSGLIDKNSKAGKAVSLAQAGINTFEGISEAVASAPFPANLPAILFASATGFGAIRNILKTKIPSMSGGNVGGGGGGSSRPKSQGLGLSGKSVNVSSNNAVVQRDIENQNPNQGANIEEAVREGSRQGTSEGANTGIRDLSENRQIANESAF